MPAGRDAEPVRGPYATRTPTAVIMTSPPTPGRATAASAHIEARRNSQARWKYDCSPIGTMSCGASGAIPDSNDSPPSAITSSDATPVAALPAVGAPGVPARGRTSGTCDAPDTPAAIPNPSPSMPPNPSTTGATPAVLNKKEERSNGSCVSGTTAPATSGTGATASITGATASVTGATASVTGATASVTGAHRVSNRRDQVGNRRDRVSNRRDQVGNRGDRIGSFRDADRVLLLVLSIRAASPCRGARRAGGRLAARAKRARWAGGRLVACLPARTNRARYIPNGLPHSVSNIADCAVSRRAALRWRVTVIPIRAGTEGIGDSDRSPTQ